MEGSGLSSENGMEKGEEIQVIQPEGDWWWAAWSVLSLVALVLNILFLVVIIKNRKNRDLRSLLTAVLITISVLDILDIGRIIPSIITNLHQYTEFRLAYCSLGVFHSVSVSLLLVVLGFYLVCPCRDAPPLYYPESTCSGSLPQKVTIPLVLVTAALGAGLLPLLPDLHPGDDLWQNVVPHSCIDPTRVTKAFGFLKREDKTTAFWADVYHSLVSVTVIVLPILTIPPTLLVAAVRAAMHGHCCQVKYKQSAGELLLVFLVTLVFLGTVVLSLLPRIDLKMTEFSSGLPLVSVLWELGNAALRPSLYFLCHPAVWDGLQGICCSGKRSYGSVSTKEDEVALAPVVERVSSL
jgi:hypothetical protein